MIVEHFSHNVYKLKTFQNYTTKEKNLSNILIISRWIIIISRLDPHQTIKTQRTANIKGSEISAISQHRMRYKLY